jgi:hypothetical protein
MAKLSELRRKQRTFTVAWPIDDSNTVEVQITYDPSKITMASQDIPDDGITLHDWHEQKFMDWVTGWDLMEDSGEPLPLTKEGLAKVESSFVAVTLRAIQENAILPNVKSTTNT